MTVLQPRDCRYVSRRLPLYAGGDLPMDIAEEVAMHLTGCPDCLSRLRLFQADRERLAALQNERLQVARPLAADDFWARVETGIRPVSLAAGHPILRARVGRGRLAAAAALLLALGLGSWALLKDRPRPASSASILAAGPQVDLDGPAFVPLRPVPARLAHQLDVQFALGDAPGVLGGGDDVIVPALVDFIEAPVDEMHYPLDDLVPVKWVAAEQGIDF